MNIIAISASNVKHARAKSTSFIVCQLIHTLAATLVSGGLDFEILRLLDFEFKPCIGCGSCFTKNGCNHDEDFNTVYHKLAQCDALFIVSAHYAPIPAKLSMLLEKIEEITFLKRFNEPDYRSPLFGKPAGLIAHGGGAGELHKYYTAPGIDSIWNALAFPVEMNVLSADEQHPHGVTFPVKSVAKKEGCIFPVQEYDYKEIENRVIPLVSKVITAATEKQNQ
jgi:multimeric flavodoxin WrbA